MTFQTGMRSSLRLWLAALAIAGVSATSAVGAPIVQTEQGRVEGVSSGEVVAFKGLPFAAPPVGGLRWKPPEAPAPWSGVRKAGDYGHSCLQPASKYGLVTDQSEDCLYLNVWAPAKIDKPLPVMVWIYGGGYVIGSGASKLYDGSAFARDGVILVTLNYRLGSLGFFAHPALTHEAAADAPLGDYGLMDQIAGLKWVKANIAKFGGDPGQVTVFGESAGAGSILYLMTTDSAKGLFQKAIVESGPAFALPASLAAKEREGEAFLARVGAPKDATAEQLRALPASSMIAPGEGVNWGPFPDGRMFKGPIEPAYASGRTVGVPMMIGSNTDDGSLGVVGYPGVPKLLWAMLGAKGDALRSIYAEMGETGVAQDRAVFNDTVFGAPARWIAGVEGARRPVYLYRYGYIPETLRGKIPGAYHAAELAYVFDTLDAAKAFGAQPTSADRQEAMLVHSCWVSFAKTGRPACAGGPEWPAYAADKDQLYFFDVAGGAKTVAGYRKAPNDFITTLVTRMMPH